MLLAFVGSNSFSCKFYDILTVSERTYISQFSEHAFIQFQGVSI